MASSSQQQQQSTSKESSPLEKSEHGISQLPLATHTYRKLLRQCVAAICTTAGFDACESHVLELLNMLTSAYLSELCESSKACAEQAARTQPCPSDVWLALINAGQQVEDLPGYLDQQLINGCVVISAPKPQPPQVQPAPLRVGSARPHPQNVHEWLPPFPDPHTYIRTEICGEPDSSYERVREMSANRRRETARSLVDYMLRVHPRACLFTAHENRLRADARATIAERERQRVARASAQKEQLAKQKMESELKQAPSKELGDDFLDDGGEEGEKMDTDQHSVPDQPSSSSFLLDDEDPFELRDTETSLVAQHMPTYCLVLEPSSEARPYLSSLICEETGDEPSEEKKEEGTKRAEEGEDQVIDNVFLRPARIPIKSDFMEY